MGSTSGWGITADILREEHHVDPCEHCGVNPRRVTSRGTAPECDACTRYRQRHGCGRPLHLIEAQIRRQQKATQDA